MFLTVPNWKWASPMEDSNRVVPEVTHPSCGSVGIRARLGGTKW
jgi:hypothetical protein